MVAAFAAPPLALGGLGILGTILVILLIVFLLTRIL